ncbi:MAG: TonB-dependent receptor [Cyclobacteriaceae bacterium]|nr:TonB-dependent receptor [Cyclobacteriaceae bacterium]MCH8517617.1 TonB-dependent receptor [Cyclobacteriaceae bacterium]
MKSISLGLTIVLILLFRPLLYSQSLTGTIVDENNEPLVGVSIIIHELNRGTTTNLEGKFKIASLKKGTYHLHFTYVGYEASHQNIRLTEGETLDLKIQMKPTVFQLKSVFIETNPFKNGPVEHSQTIEVLDRAYMERYNAGNFANSIERLPGISSINTGVGISKPVIRGMSFNRIMVNDRGIKQEGQQWGADHGLEIDPFDVDRVEIIKGPASLIYGSDGMAGVINIRPAAPPSKGTTRGSVVNGFRTNNDMYSTSAFVETNQNDIIFRARLTYQRFGDYRVPAENFNFAGFILPIFDNRLKNTAGEERHFSITSGVKKDWGYSTVTVSQFGQDAGIFPGAVGIPNSFSLRHNGDNRNIEFPRQENRHIKVISNTNINIGGDWLEIDLAYQNNLRNEKSFPDFHGVEPRPDNNLALGLDLDTYTANVRYNRNTSEKKQIIYGLMLQYMQNRQEGFEFLIPNFSTFQYGAFYFQEYRWKPNLIINAGARWDGARHDIQEHLQPVYERLRFTGEFDQRNPDIDEFFQNASVSMGLSWIPHENWNLKVNLGSAFRIPTAIEMSSNGVHHGNFRHEVGNPELTPERSYQADLNLTYSSRKFLVSIMPFWGYFDDYIYLAPSPRFSRLPTGGQLWEYRQDNAIFTGTEVKFDYSPIKGLFFRTAGEYVYNYNLNTNLPLPLTPPLSFLQSIEYNFPDFLSGTNNWYAFFEVRWAADQNRVDRNERTTEGYTLLGAGFGFDFSVGNQDFNFQANAENLADTFYLNHLSRYRLLNLPEQGRNFSFSLKVPFGNW